VSFLPYKSGFFYFLILFAVGFVLGTVRVLVTAPLMHEALATLLGRVHKIPSAA
jgi:hypothetical protein